MIVYINLVVNTVNSALLIWAEAKLDLTIILDFLPQPCVLKNNQ